MGPVISSRYFEDPAIKRQFTFRTAGKVPAVLPASIYMRPVRNALIVGSSTFHSALSQELLKTGIRCGSWE